jgi:cell division protein FtsA
MAFEEVKKSEYINLMATGLVLTGGASLLPGTLDLAEEIFNMPVKLGRPTGFTGMISEAGRPQCATGVGLILYALKQAGEDEPGFGGTEMGVFEGMMRRFRRIFGRNKPYGM